MRSTFLALLSVSAVYASPLAVQSEPTLSSAVSASSDAVSSGTVSSDAISSSTSSASPSVSGAPVGTTDDAALTELLNGNKEFKASSKLAIAQNLTTNGPNPPFMLFECSDSRVTAGTILNAPLGTVFGHHNLGNLYSQTDANADAALVYGVEELGVKHIIVMGHYGCPTVGAALLGNDTTPKPKHIKNPKNTVRAEPDNSTRRSTEVEAWIQPIRELYLSSNRSEIAALRETDMTELPKASDPGFRALVEENVKASVTRIQKDSILAKLYASPAASSLASSASSTSSSSASSEGTDSASPSKSIFSAKPKGSPPHKPKNARQAESASAEPSLSGVITTSALPGTPTGSPTQVDVFVHGFVYDMESGDVLNLGVTFGPAGKTLPKVPFSAVASATKALDRAHSASETASASVPSA
ncbi:carbonic anhydrase [Mycena rebaudengoi]|nr:carbonic anhydrase [Mycena rebaudengoi]